MSGILTTEMADTVLVLFDKFIDPFLASGVPKRSALAVAILDTEGEVLSERAYGTIERVEWPHDFAEIARGKARASYRAGMNTSKLIATRLELMRPGDPPFSGGVHRHGFVVGASGIQQHFDEAVATAIAAFCEAFVRDCIDTLSMDFCGKAPPTQL